MRFVAILLLAVLHAAAFDPSELNTGRLNHSYSWEDEHGNFISLNHTAQHPVGMRLLELDRLTKSIHVVCKAEAIAMSAQRNLVETLQPGLLIVGSAWWNCSTPATPIMRRLVAVTYDGSWVNCTTAEASYEDFFEHASISLSTNILGQLSERAREKQNKQPQHEQPLEHQHEPPQEQPHKERPPPSRRRMNILNELAGLPSRLGCSAPQTSSQGLWGVIGTVAMIGFSGVECVASKAVAAAAKLGEIVEGVVDFAAQIVSGTLDPPISFRQRIGSWSANFDGGFRKTYNRHIENEWEGRRLAVATCLRCSDHQGSLMCSTNLGVNYCPPVEGENHLDLPGGGNCVYFYSPSGDGTLTVQQATCSITRHDKYIVRSGTTEQTKRHACALDACGCDNGGHILASQLGGCGGCPVNIFPQNAYENQQGAWKSFENAIAECLQGSGEIRATLTWRFEYSTRTKRPSSITYGVSYEGSICQDQSEVFLNECNAAPPPPLPSPLAPLPPLGTPLAPPPFPGLPVDIDVDSIRATRSIDLDVSAGIACTNCYAFATADLIFNLAIEHHTVKVAEVFAEGHAKVNVEATADLQASYNDVGKVELPEFPSVPMGITFSVGPVPVYIEFVVLTEVGHLLSASGGLKLSLAASAEGFLKFGVSYRSDRAEEEACGPEGSTSPLQTVSKADWSSTARSPQLEAVVDVGFQMYIQPTVMLRAYKIGGPTLSIKGYLEASIDGSAQASSDGVQSCVEASASLGAQISVGAKLDVLGFFVREIQSKPIYSAKWPVGTLDKACASFGTGGRRLQECSVIGDPSFNHVCQGAHLSQSCSSGCGSGTFPPCCKTECCAGLAAPLPPPPTPPPLLRPPTSPHGPCFGLGERQATVGYCGGTPGCGWCRNSGDNYWGACCGVAPTGNGPLLPCDTPQGTMYDCDRGFEGQDLTPTEQAHLGKAFRVGKAFTGKLRRIKDDGDCGNVPEFVVLSMQVVSKPIAPEGFQTDTSMDLLVTLSSAGTGENGKSLFSGLDQQLWEAEIRDSQFRMVRSSRAADATFQMCTTKNAAQAWTQSVSQWLGQASFGTMVLEDSMRCTTVEIQLNSTASSLNPSYSPPSFHEPVLSPALPPSLFKYSPPSLSQSVLLPPFPLPSIPQSVLLPTLPPLVYTYAPPSLPQSSLLPLPQTSLLPPPFPQTNSTSVEPSSSDEVVNTSYIAAQPPVGMGGDKEQGIRITLIILGIIAVSVAGILAFVALRRYRSKTGGANIVELGSTRHELQLIGKRHQLQV